ncbi:MAG: cobalamin biosynthesis protein CobD [Opitutales bacterium]|nr:cobalamin biosynthesis protein CobD [Opitutales bacterium]
MHFGVMWSSNPILLLTVILADLVLGDPRYLPHLVRYTGNAILYWEHKTREQGYDSVFHGAVFFVLVQGSILLPLFSFWALTYWMSPLLGRIVEALILFQCIGAGDLLHHVKAVARPLNNGNLPEARTRVSWIVGRDTENLSSSEVSRATIETLMESFNDAVMAPIFWYLLLGAPGALFFRITNTMDSMVGYRNAKYERFGKVAARIDDILGYVPARICALALWVICGCRHFKAIATDARKHNSPNAGWPEAAAAYGLNVRLGGTNTYGHGSKVSHSHVFNSKARKTNSLDIYRALRLFLAAYVVAAGVSILIAAI